MDLPIKSNDEIFHFFEKNNGYQFINFDDKMLNNPEVIRRTKLYHFFQNYRRRFKFSIGNQLFTFIERFLLLLQLIFRVNRLKGESIQIKYGSNWFSITHDLVTEILETFPSMKKIFMWTNSSDELVV